MPSIKKNTNLKDYQLNNNKKLLKARHRLTFWFGIVILCLFVITFVCSWISDGHELKVAFSKLSQETRDKLILANALPSVSGAMLQVRFTFTYISNILIGFALIFYGLLPNYLWTKRGFFLATVYINITFFTFWGLIIPFVFINPNIWYEIPWNWKVLTVPVHLINPVIGTTFFIINRRELVVSHKTMLLSSIFMLGYYLFAVLIFWIGVQVTNLFLIEQFNKKTTGLDIFTKTKVAIYPFLNLKYPLGYHGNNLVYKILLNLFIPIFGIIVCISVAYFLKFICKIQTYSKKNFENPAFLRENKLLIKSIKSQIFK